MFRESHARSVAKALSWRLMGSAATSALVLAFTGRFALSLAVGAIEGISKIGLYWLHERLWDRLRFGKQEASSAVIWLTGLSGAGKSTIAQLVAKRLRDTGVKVEELDGDSIRDIFPSTGFTRTEREDHIRRVGYLASRLERHGVFVVASLVSPYEASRQFVRRLCGNFVEIHVATSLEACEQRDVKGLYAKARRGEIRGFTGIDDPYETPSNPELVLDTTKLSVEDAAEQVLNAIRQRIEQAGSQRGADLLATVRQRVFQRS